MARKWLWTSLISSAGAAAVAVAVAHQLPTGGAAEPPKEKLTTTVVAHTAQDESPSARTIQLPIGRVVLFSSGVGYFQREGAVEGNARVDLSFPVTDVNDLLKSMVLRDLDGGHISTVSYDSNAPVERTL